MTRVQCLLAPRLNDPCSVQSVGSALAICTHPRNEIKANREEQELMKACKGKKLLEVG